MLAAPNSEAHQTSDSYLNLVFNRTNTNTTCQWDIRASDLEYVVGLDDNDDGSIAPEEMLAHQKAIDGFVSKHLKIKFDGVETPLTIVDHELAAQQDGVYVSLKISLPGQRAPKILEVSYNLFFDLNPQHRGLFLLECDGKKQTAIFTPASATQQFQLTAPSAFAHFSQFVREGITHIWLGFDHILFLLALLLPAVLRRSQNKWEPVANFRPALINVLKIVTAFTVAHSITLTLATLKIVQVPSRLIESAIAVSVALAAFNNLRPLFRDGAWMVAFAFGLIHGFGFANALTELGTSNANLAMTLFGFNLGVEIGQLAIVAAFLPIAFGMRSSWFYQRVTLTWGSVVIILLASVWVGERAFDLKLMPF
ncbi:MAG: lnt [Verrucomicrobiales bacterium]|nr:lnt [Verrucomicrobiales bacterium]